MSPFSKGADELGTAFSAMEAHDYDAIPLWYAHKEDGYGFCRALVQSMLATRGISDRDEVGLLGVSEFETSVEEWKEHGTAYRSGSKAQLKFEELAKKDYTFRKYLKNNKIDVADLKVENSDVRASYIRKITSLVTVRETFRAPDAPDDSVNIATHGHHRNRKNPTLRSRKNPDLYSGANSLFAMSEGNPRWLKGIMSRLLVKQTVDGKINASDQNTEVLNAAHRFRALLQTIPCPPITGSQPTRGILSVLDAVGEHCFYAIVLADFDPEPPGSFQVDSRTSPGLLESLGRALNAGAIVHVPDGADIGLLKNLRGKRFRLSYLLAPHYGLPLILGKSVALSSILKQKATPLFPPIEQEET